MVGLSPTEFMPCPAHDIKVVSIDMTFFHMADISMVKAFIQGRKQAVMLYIYVYLFMRI